MDSKYIVIDAGNTNIEIGLYNSNSILNSWRFSTDTTRTEDEYFAVLNSLAESQNISLSSVKVCAIASVVPELTRIFNHLFSKYFTAKIVNVSAYSDLGLKFPTTDPGFIGADLIVNAYASINKYRTNTIVCDFGTATTIQLTGADGFFHGTIIAPGIVISSTHLFQKASLLTKIQLETPQKILGKNTKDALLSGIVKGHCLMCDAFIREIKSEHQELKEIKVIATGGIAHLLSDNMKEIDVFDKTLTIDGLFSIAKKSQDISG